MHLPKMLEVIRCMKHSECTKYKSLAIHVSASMVGMIRK